MPRHLFFCPPLCTPMHGTTACACAGAGGAGGGAIELNNLPKTPKKCTFRGHTPQRRHLHPCFNPRQVADIACFPLLLRAHKKFHFLYRDSRYTLLPARRQTNRGFPRFSGAHTTTAAFSPSFFSQQVADDAHFPLWLRVCKSFIFCFSY